MKKEKGLLGKNMKSYDFLPDISETASFTECTGLMPSPARNEDELESYGELFSPAHRIAARNNRAEM